MKILIIWRDFWKNGSIKESRGERKEEGKDSLKGKNGRNENRLNGEIGATNGIYSGRSS